MRPDRRPHAALAELVAQLDAGSRSRAHFPQLPELQQMQQQWAALHEESRLRVALHEAPAEGGPLNSAVLVHRMLEMMRAASPAYLRSFVGHADALAWLEATLPGTAESTGAAKPARPRAPRSRKPSAPSA